MCVSEGNDRRLAGENSKMSATLQVHDRLIQSLRLRDKPKEQVFGKSPEREIQQLELALEDLLIAAAESSTTPLEVGKARPVASTPKRSMRRLMRVLEKAARERKRHDPGTCCPDCGGELGLIGERLADSVSSLVFRTEKARYRSHSGSGRSTTRLRD